MKRITLLIDVMASDDQIAELQRMMSDQPTVNIMFQTDNKMPLRVPGRFMGAQEARGGSD